jgi:hypothetical protein
LKCPECGQVVICNKDGKTITHDVPYMRLSVCRGSGKQGIPLEDKEEKK